MTPITQKIIGTTLILGGARSGKSAYAEQLALSANLHPVYIATAQPHDDEMANRITIHQNRRGSEWTTIEQPLELCDALKDAAKASNIILVDCLTLWLSNLMMAKRNIEEETANLTALMPTLGAPVIFVSNEVGMGLVPETAIGREFRDHQGKLNQAVAKAADTVSFIAAGYPITLKAPSTTESSS